MQVDSANASSPSIHRLNGFLRGEITAVIAYGQMGDRLRLKHARAAALCPRAQRSHAERVHALCRWIPRVGGTPAVGPGRWSIFSDLCDADASEEDEAAILLAIARRERWTTMDYLHHLAELDGKTRDFLMERVLPLQERTQAMVQGPAVAGR
jgi:hypothetical protein